MTTVNLIPNYDKLRNQFERDATYTANSIVRTMKSEPKVDQDDVRRLLVSLNIALQSVNTPEALQEFRITFNTLVSGIAKANDEYTTNAAEVEYDDNY